MELQPLPDEVVASMAVRGAVRRGNRAAAAVFLTVVAVILSGCSATSAREDPAGGDDVADQAEVVTDDGQVTEAGGTEEGGPQPEEEAAGAEGPADGGGGRVSIELAGLPVGGGEVLDVDGTWCQVLFWQSVPAGVWLDIDAVQVRDQRGTLLAAGCDGSPPCAGVRISADAPGGCAVVIRPVSPDIEFVEVQLNGTLSCPDQASCDAIGATDGSWTRIGNPTPGVPSEGLSTPDGGSPDGQAGGSDAEPSSDGEADLTTTGTG